MSDDNIILDDTPSEDEQQDQADDYAPEMTDADFILAAYYALSAVDSIDAYLESDKKMVRRIQRRCLLTIDICTKNLYELLTDTENQ